MVSVFEPYMATMILTVLVGIWAFISSLELLRESFELKNARAVFWKINAAFLAIIILLSLDEYIKHHIS